MDGSEIPQKEATSQKGTNQESSQSLQKFWVQDSQRPGTQVVCYRGIAGFLHNGSSEGSY